MNVYLSKLAEYKLTKLIIYIEEEWGEAAKKKLVQKLKRKLKQVSAHPESNPKTEGYDDVFWCVVTPQTSFYYRILESENEIEVITITDNRQNPENIIKEIRSYFNS